MARVTVGIPAYKAEHLGQAIASVLAQTFGDFELLISDDSPDDAVAPVVARFADPRIRVIQGPRRGLVANSAHLWEQAGCDLLKYVYDDDFLLPFALAELVKALDRDPALTFAFCARHVVDADGRVLHSPQRLASGRTTVFGPGALAESLLGAIRNLIGEPTSLLIRRSAFDDATCLSRYGGLAVRHHIDVAFFLNASGRGPCIGVPAFGAAFRRHAAQVTALERAPDFSYGAAEWELFLRVAVSQGAVAPQVPLRSFERLHKIYERFGAGFPELAPMVAGLPALRAALERGEREVLDADYLGRLAAVETAIAQRKAAP